MATDFTSSTLNYPITSASAIKRVKSDRDPAGKDGPGYTLGDEWLNVTSNRWFKLARKGNISQSSAVWVEIGAPSEIDTIQGNTGGPVAGDSNGNIFIMGSPGLTVSGNPGTNTLMISVVGGGFGWQVISANQALVNEKGYFTNGASRLLLSLPATSVVGDTIQISTINSNGWRITQSAGQKINIGNFSTTLGASGYIESTNLGDWIELTCYVANTSWIALGNHGNITIV